MDLIGLLIALIIVGAIAYLAYWLITHFFPEPIRTPALIIVGVILLLILLGQFTGHVPRLRL